jgi:hypothetical protein
VKKAVSLCLNAGALSYAAFVSFFSALTSAVNHDENQFIAGAYMVARYGLQPYQDFAYFQMPNLVYVYVPLFYCHDPFLAARLCNGLCGFGLCLTVFLTARSLFHPLGVLIASAISAAVTVLLPNTFLFQFTVSKVWNHASATLCAVLAVLLHNKAMRDRRFGYFVLSGFALGMALGIRLTFAPLIIPFVLAILVFCKGSWLEKARNTLAFTAGGLLANLPAVYFCLTSFRDFVFGNLGYRKLDLLYQREAMPHSTRASLVGKIHYLIDSFSSDMASLLVAWVALAIVIMLISATISHRSKPRVEFAFLVGVLVFLLPGAFAPTPAQYQYWFVFVPFLLLLSLWALSSLAFPKLLLTGALLLVIASGSSFFNATQVRKSIMHLDTIFRSDRWIPLRVEQEGQWIRRQLDSKPQGKVLTLSPLYAAEAGLPIYKEFVTGPFAMRVSSVISADEAAARKLPYAADVDKMLRTEPPMAVLVGEDKHDRTAEEPIIREIALLWYSPTITPHGAVLWQPHE